MVGELDRLFRAGGREQQIFLRQLERLRAANHSIEIHFRNGQARARKRFGHLLHFPKGLSRIGIKASYRVQNIAFKCQAFRRRKGEINAIIGAAFGQNAGRAVEWINFILLPPIFACEPFFNHQVQHMVARIAFMTAQIDRTADTDRQVGVDLDQAFIIALIIIIA